MKESGPLGRFVTRGRDDGRVDLALFLPVKDSGLKPNTVYELYRLAGEVFLQELGPSIMQHASAADRHGMPCWGQDVSLILRQGSKYLVLTEQEYLEHVGIRLQRILTQLEDPTKTEEP